uniref:Uncharacterized protein n=1 Tax=viral metagenome TaxID=1070528 RepID=A0A6M3JQI2_9ZZZZ
MELADKLTLKGTIVLSAKSVNEFEELMIEIQKLKENFVAHQLNIVAEWQTMLTMIPDESLDSRKLVGKDIRQFDIFVSKIRTIEEELEEMLKRHLPEDMEAKYVFNCTVTLKYEKREKDAQDVMKDSDQLMLFGPYSLLFKEQQKLGKSTEKALAQKE